MLGIGNRAAGQKFCDFTGFPASSLFIDERAQLHSQLELYPGLSLKLPGCSTAQNAWFNLLKPDAKQKLIVENQGQNMAEHLPANTLAMISGGN